MLVAQASRLQCRDVAALAGLCLVTFGCALPWISGGVGPGGSSALPGMVYLDTASGTVSGYGVRVMGASLGLLLVALAAVATIAVHWQGRSRSRWIGVAAALAMGALWGSQLSGGAPVMRWEGPAVVLAGIVTTLFAATAPTMAREGSQ